MLRTESNCSLITGCPLSTAIQLPPSLFASTAHTGVRVQGPLLVCFIYTWSAVGIAFFPQTTCCFLFSVLGASKSSCRSYATFDGSTFLRLRPTFVNRYSITTLICRWPAENVDYCHSPWHLRFVEVALPRHRHVNPCLSPTPRLLTLPFHL